MSYDTRQRDETPHDATSEEETSRDETSYDETPRDEASYEQTSRPDEPDDLHAEPTADYPGETPEPYRTDDRVADQTTIDGTTVDGTAVDGTTVDGTTVDGTAVDDETLVEGLRDGDPAPGEPVPVPPGTGPSVPATGAVPDSPVTDGAVPDGVVAAAAPEPASTTLWPHEESTGFQNRWREVQLRFVDDPRGATEEAEALAGEVLEQFTAAVTARKRELDGWREHTSDSDHDGGGTERMRVAVRHYRQLLDRIFQA